MANDFKITDVVGDEAFTQLGKLKTELKETTTLYSSLVVNIARSAKSNPKTFEELSDKAKGFQSSVEKLNSTQEKMNLIQTRQLAILRQVSQQLNAMSSLSKLNTLFEQFAKNVKNASDMLQSLSSTSNNVAASQENAAKSTQNASNTINQASVQLQAANVNYATIIDTIQGYDNAVTKLTADTIANKEEMNKIISDINKLAKEYRSGKISLTEYTQQAALLKQRHIELMAQNQQNTALIKNHSAAIISATGSYYEMNAAMLELQKRYKALTEEQRNSPMGEGLIKQANALNDKLKEIDAKFGNYQRNVGNYASSWNGLNVQTQQLLRELPSLTMSFNQFFLAISNNLPMFADELKRASEEFKRMKAEGQTAIPVWKQLLGSLFSWQSALVIGITLLSAYGNEIIDWVGSLFKGKKTLEEIINTEIDLANARRKGISDSIKERTELDLLYKATQDTSRSMKERNAAVDELQKKYPAYFGNMSNEEILVGKAKNSYKELTKALIANARARAIEDKLVENSKKRTEQMDKVVNAEYQAMMKEKKLNELMTKTPEGNYGSITINYDKLRREIESLKETAQSSRDAILSIDLANKKLAKSINVSDLLNDFGKEDKKKAEEYAEYIKKITEDLEKSRIDIIADGRKREIAEVEKEYNDQIKAIKGNSAKEIELRTNLEILKRKTIAEINDKYDKGLIEIEKNNLENRLDSLGENSERELNERLNIQLELNDMMRNAEIKNAEKNGEDVSAIIDKYGKRQNDIIMRNLENRFTLIENATDRMIDRQETASIEEYNVIKMQYAKGEISREDYEKKTYEIGAKYAKARLQTMIKEVQAEMALLDPDSDKYADLEDRLANIQAQINNISFDEAINKSEQAKEEFKEALHDMNNAARDALGDTAGIFEGLSTIIEDLAEDGKLSFESLLKSVAQIMDGITSLMVDMYDAKIESLEKEQDANDEAYDKEIERIEALNENGAISTEEAEARKRAAEDKTQRKNAELEKQKQAIQQKQAKWEKANSIIQTTIATAQAIMKAYAMTGPIAGAIFSAIIGAMGAAQIAIIASQQIPKYAKGTKDHPGGLAIVGDGGKKEGVITEKGLFVTPDKPTLVDLPKHAQVMPDLSFIYDRKGLGSDFLLLEQQKKNMVDKGIIVNVDNDYSRLEKKMEGNTKQLQSINKLMRKANRNAEFNWISNRV
jgi:hypothetical protein